MYMNSSGGSLFGVFAVAIALLVLYLVAFVKIFQKAGKPGWHAIIPYLSTYDLFEFAWSKKMAGIGLGVTIAYSVFAGSTTASDSEGASVLVTLLSLAYMVIYLILLYKLSKSFGHGVGFFLGLLFLSPIFILILAFGSSSYFGPSGEAFSSYSANQYAGTKTGYGVPQQSYDPTQTYGQSQQSYDPTQTYGQSQQSYDPTQTYGQSQQSYDPTQTYGQTQQGYAQNSNPFENNNNYGNYR